MLTPKFDTCFFERYAMVSLATLLGEHYAHLVNRDRPDLQDEEQGIGIEVTRAIRENKNVANALVNEMAGEDIKEVNAEDLRRICVISTKAVMPTAWAMVHSLVATSTNSGR